MASAILYPPIVDGYVPAVATGQKIFIPFSFSKFNAADADSLVEGKYPEFDRLTVHAVIYEVTSGQSMVNTNYTYNNGEDFNDGYTESGNVYAGSGTIINLTPVKIKDNLYQIQLVNSLFKGGKPTECKMYKIQLRFSGKTYTGMDGETQIAQADWLNKNASFFSEWSTVCILKYTYVPVIQFKNPATINIQEIWNKKDGLDITYNTNNLFFYGNYTSQDQTEYLTSYRIQLYNTNNKLLEDTQDILVNDYSQTKAGSFNHELKTELQNNTTYVAYFSYITNNYFTDTIKFTVNATLDSTLCDLVIDTIDSNNSKVLNNLTSVALENDDARVAIFVAAENKDNALPKGSQYRIKRYSSKDNFKTSEEVVIFKTSQDNWHGVIGPFYDWNIESGIIYRYAIQKMTKISEDKEEYIPSSSLRKHTKIIENIKEDGSIEKKEEKCYILRDFDFSFLLGRNSRQLKLMFDQQLNNFNIYVNDSQVTTIGGRYPFITRNGDTRYKTFPITGLISFNMDENELFTNKKELLNIPDDEELENNEVYIFYNKYNKEHGINQGNNVIYEKMFRDKVLEFLYDDKPKLFKSPTEGNIIVRITNVSCTPNMTLNKMIYNFNGTASEVADNTIENCVKYKFIDTTYGVVSADLEYEISDWGERR